ncbi:MAG: hypothetical protein ABFD46_12980 [Armatimonadota bacterium]
MINLKKMIIVVLAALILGFIFYWYVPWSIIEGVSGATRIDTGFATKAYVKDYWSKEHVDAVITDKNDIAALKKILGGWATQDGRARMFDIDVSVTLTNGRKSITFCPELLEGNPVIKIYDTGKCRHISLAQNKILYRILNKYGMDIPIIKK